MCLDHPEARASLPGVPASCRIFQQGDSAPGWGQWAVWEVVGLWQVAPAQFSGIWQRTVVG